MANIRGLIDTSDYETGIKKLDVRDMIFQLQPDAAPFTTILMKMNKDVATDIQFFWFEDDLLGNYTTFTADPTASTTQTVFTVTSTAMFQEGDVVGCFSSDVGASEENALVVAIDSSTTMRVVRQWGSTTVAAHAIGDYVYKLGSAMQEGYDAPESLVTAKERKDNYVQLFSRTVMITETAEKVATYGGNRRNFERNKVGVELKREIESQFLWGEKKLDTTGSTHPRYQTAGVYSMLGTTAPELDMAGAVLTESAFEGWLKNVFLYSGEDRFLFAGPLVISEISQFAAGKQRVEPGTTIKYGVKVRTYHSALGDVNLVLDRHFIGPHAGKGLLLDVKQLVYRYLQDSDFSLALNLQPRKSHYKLDEYTATIGFELHHPALHGRLVDVG